MSGQARNQEDAPYVLAGGDFSLVLAAFFYLNYLIQYYDSDTFLFFAVSSTGQFIGKHQSAELCKK